MTLPVARRHEIVTNRKMKGHHVSHVGNEEMLQSNTRRDSRVHRDRGVGWPRVEDTRTVTYPSLSYTCRRI